MAEPVSSATWVSVDVLAITPGEEPALVLARRQRDPHKGKWALPGVVLDAANGETVAAAADRAVRDRAGSEPVPECPATVAAVVSDPERDERGHTVSLVNTMRAEPGSGDDIKLIRVGDYLPDLPFGHARIIRSTAETLSHRLLTDRETAMAMFGGGCIAAEATALTELLYHLAGGVHGRGAEPITLGPMRRRLERAALFAPGGIRPAHTRPMTVYQVTPR
jgi:8-oxo-dGTP diphosphatase